MTSAWGMLIYAVPGIVGGWGGSKLKLPAGALIGAMMAIILFKIITRFHWEMPRSFAFSLLKINLISVMVTSNHIRLLVYDRKEDVILKSVQLIAGRTAKEYNIRKNRTVAFWEDRYHATVVHTDGHFIRPQGSSLL